MPRNSRIFYNLRKLKIALDVDRDVIDGDVGSKSQPTESNRVARSNVTEFGKGNVRNITTSYSNKLLKTKIGVITVFHHSTYPLF